LTLVQFPSRFCHSSQSPSQLNPGGGAIRHNCLRARYHCRDIHGQFSDLRELFFVGVHPPETNYCFLFLLALKVRLGRLRGNRESRQTTQAYGFSDECLRKYGNPNVWKRCADVFDWMSLSAVVESRIFCVNGGLSPAIQSLEQLKALEPRQEIPHTGAISDLLWRQRGSSLYIWPGRRSAIQ
jgi:hypothetical protein